MLCLAPLLAACGAKHEIEINYHFSVNVIRTPLWFPDKKMKLSPAETEVIELRGRPNFIHFWWKPDGSLIGTKDFSSLQPNDIRDQMGEAQKSWIYVNDNDKTEIIFSTNGTGYRPAPLSEELQLVCKYGDPSSKTPPAMQGADTVESWQWYDQGVGVTLVNGHVTHTEHFAAAGAGTDLTK